MASDSGSSAPAPRRETGKKRASRIELTFYRQLDAVGKARLVAILVVCLLLAVYLGFGLRPAASERYSHGPVAACHVAWEQDCMACHEAFVPLRSDAWWHDDQAADTAQRKCNQCHLGETHHADRTRPTAQFTETCASCHRDHQGRQAQLAMVADQACTSCHGALDDVRTDEARQVPDAIHAVVHSFVDDHPAFRSLQDDPGTVKFDHHQHMTAGIPATDEPPRWKLSQLSDEERQSLLATGDAAGFVQLQCSSCHQPQGGPADPASIGGGQHMRPVNFNQHCRACHKLHLPGDASLAVQHGRSFEQMQVDLQGLFAGRMLAEQPGLTAPLVPGRRIPGNRDVGPSAQQTEVRQAIAGQVTRALQILEQDTCRKCHNVQAATAESPPLIPAARIPAVWFRHARFNHAAHLEFQCAACHQQAYPHGPRQNPDDQEVMIAGLETCRQCHSPQGTVAGRPPTNGARFDCIECHRYHVDSASGLAPQRGWFERTIDEYQNARGSNQEQ